MVNRPEHRPVSGGLWSRTPFAGVPAKTAIAVAVAAAIAAGGAVWRYQPVSAEEFSLDDAQAAEQADRVDEAAQEEPQLEEVVVDVAGAVATPGVYRLAQGSRVIDAVEAAGGATDDAVTSTVNLARVLQDGEQVLIPNQDDTEAATRQVVATNGVAPLPVNINTAGIEELDTLPGIGPSTAQKIVDDRERNGPFASPEDLKRVSGIGDKKYEQLAGLIAV